MHQFTQTLRRKRLVALNWTLTLLGVGLAIFVLVAEKIVPLSENDSRLLLSVLLLILTFQITQVVQTLTIDTKLGEFSATEMALERLGDARTLVDDLLQKLAFVHHEHEQRCRDERVMRDSRTFLRQREILDERIRLMLKESIRNADELLNGKFQTYFWSCRVLHEAVKHMDRTLIGLSPLSTTDTSWWTCPDGEEFLAINRNAVKSSKQVTRIFVYEPEQLQELGRLIDQHRDAATELYSIDTVTLHKQGFGKRHEAVAVVDDALMFRAETGVPNRTYDRNRFSVRPDRIKAQLAELENIRRMATKHHTSPPPQNANGAGRESLTEEDQ